MFCFCTLKASCGWCYISKTTRRRGKRNMKQLQVFQVNLPTEEQTKYQVDAVFLIREITRWLIQRVKHFQMAANATTPFCNFFMALKKKKKTSGTCHPPLQDFFKVHFFETQTGCYASSLVAPAESCAKAESTTWGKKKLSLHVTS